MTDGVSVALCTYNGGRYLRAQLDSIAAQTLAPHEIVICDDGSDDGTVDVAEAFARAAAFAVRVMRNETRLGVAKNYERAIGLCDGSLIALADQDDVWAPEKLRRLAGAVEHAGAAYAFCDARIVDEDGRDLGGSSLLVRRFSLSRIEQAFRDGRELDLLLKRDFVYGTTLVFRAVHRDLLLPIGDHWSHDSWIVNVAALAGLRGAPVLEPLVRYRQHAVQASGGIGAHVQAPYEDRVRAYEELRAHGERLARDLGGTLAPRALERVDDKLRYLRALVEMQAARQPGKTLIAAREVLAGRWSRYSPRTFF